MTENKPISEEDIVWVVKGKFTIKRGGLIDFKKDDIIFTAIPVERIKQACEFYLRYKNNSGLLIKEHPELRKELKKGIIKYYDYNEWLFRLAFKEVLRKTR